jgi:tRNA dimethylallyltransferase
LRTGEIKAILIAGPTASGKSALAIELAKALSGIVINADSMQVYEDLRIITARPTKADEGTVPHRLYGHVDASTNYSVGRYMDDVNRLLPELGGRLPIFVGGTGLYFKALTEGLSEMPPVPDAVREAVRRESEGVETPALHALLATRDPLAAERLRPSDRLRVQRALEIFATTGRSVLSFHGARQEGPFGTGPILKVFLAPEREELRTRIDQRFIAMAETGAVEEVRALAARSLDSMLPAMRAHGVPGLIAHLHGEITLAQAIERGQADTRRYAKRQFTWFRHQLPDWGWVQPARAFDTVMMTVVDQPKG